MLRQARKNVTECIELIYSAASNSREWLLVLKELQKFLNSSAVAWAEYDFARKEGGIIHAVGYDSEYIRRYSDQYASLNAWMQPGDWYKKGQVSVGEEILSEEKLAKTEYYNNWLKPQDFFYRVCAVAKQEDTRICYLEALRSKAQGSYTPSEQRFLSKLLPHIMQAMKLNDYLWQRAVIGDVLKQQPYGVLVVNKKGQLLFSNDLAKELLDKQDGLYLSGGILYASKAQVDGKLKDLIAGATSTLTSTKREPGGLIAAPRSGNQLPLWAVVSPLRRKLRRVIGQENEVVLIFVNAPEYVGELPNAMLRTLYGFTGAEQRLLRLILKGYRLNEASEELGISPNTTRTHMKHIYDKTGVERQVDLVRLFLTSNLLTQYEEVTASELFL